jgi:hypothetical protein
MRLSRMRSGLMAGRSKLPGRPAPVLAPTGAQP